MLPYLRRDCRLMYPKNSGVCPLNVFAAIELYPSYAPIEIIAHIDEGGVLLLSFGLPPSPNTCEID